MSVSERFSLTLTVSGDNAHAHMSAHERERLFFNSKMPDIIIINCIKLLYFSAICNKYIVY